MIADAILKKGATPSFTGGTDMVFSASGKSIPNGLNIVDTGEEDFRLRTNISVRNVEYKLDNATGEWGKGNRSLTLTVPVIRPSGKQGFPCFRIKFEDFPETTLAEKVALRILAAQAILDGDFDNFWNMGTTR